MIGYSNLLRRSPVSVSTTPVKLFDPPALNRLGWRVFIPTSLAGSVGVRFLVRPPGGSAPTFSELTAAGSFRAEAGFLVQDAARSGLEVWVVVESGSVTLVPEEVMP